MEINPNLLAPCGLYCGVCAVRMATVSGNRKFKERLVAVYQPIADRSLTTDDIRCEGCLSDETFLFCKVCPVKDCVKDKNISGCHQCAEFPCAFVENFPIPVGKSVILRAIPYWREHGTEKYVADEEARYLCPDCGNKLFRGARRCNRCKREVSVD